MVLIIVSCKKASESQTLSCRPFLKEEAIHKELPAGQKEHGLDIHGKQMDVLGTPGLCQSLGHGGNVLLQGQGDQRDLRERRGNISKNCR